MLNFLSNYESVQVCLALATGACIFALIITVQINRQVNKTEILQFEREKWKQSVAEDEDKRAEKMIRLKDEIAENEKRRKIDLHLTEHPEHRPLTIDHQA